MRTNNELIEYTCECCGKQYFERLEDSFDKTQNRFCEECDKNIEQGYMDAWERWLEDFPNSGEDKSMWYKYVVKGE